MFALSRHSQNFEEFDLTLENVVFELRIWPRFSAEKITYYSPLEKADAEHQFFLTDLLLSFVLIVSINSITNGFQAILTKKGEIQKGRFAFNERSNAYSMVPYYGPSNTYSSYTQNEGGQASFSWASH